MVGLRMPLSAAPTIKATSQSGPLWGHALCTSPFTYPALSSDPTTQVQGLDFLSIQVTQKQFSNAQWMP